MITCSGTEAQQTYLLQRLFERLVLEDMMLCSIVCSLEQVEIFIDWTKPWRF